MNYDPDWWGSVGSVPPHKVKGRQLDSWSGHVPGLWVQFPVGMNIYGSQSMSLSHIDVSLSLFLPVPFSVKSINISSGED